MSAQERARILVVDDHEDNILILGELLDRTGFEVAVARDALEALATAETFRPDLVLLDVMMPGMDGMEVCRRIKATARGTAVILVSARVQEDDQIEGLDSGADDYVTKPYGSRELLARVRAQLRVKELQDELRWKNRTLTEISSRDALTGVFNRGRFDVVLDEEVSRARRYGKPLSLVLIDIDHFKRVNDLHGHPAGDEVLRVVARIIAAGVRDCDTVARYGGEEFGVVLPEQGMAGVLATAERLRENVEVNEVQWNGVVIPVTVSIGVASWGTSMTDPLDLLAAADRCLYCAKNQGRNTVSA